ncbi:MAG: ECF transporter S component [Clostridia bacterium]|nr:ECF transporter S component [Clostridia bacterium]
MYSKQKDIRWMVSVALMVAVVVLLANTPLGMIQLPIIKATTVHIPVIIGAIILGSLAGAILGASFGICSVISNTMTPSLLSFAFSPFLSTTGIVGGIKAVWVAVGCRILIGVAAGWLWILFKKVKVPSPVALALTGFLGSMVNTITVMGSIYLLFAQQYAEAKDVAMNAVFGLVMTTVTASGIPEAIAAAVLVTVIGAALLKAMPRIMPEKKRKTPAEIAA